LHQCEKTVRGGAAVDTISIDAAEAAWDRLHRDLDAAAQVHRGWRARQIVNETQRIGTDEIDLDVGACEAGLNVQIERIAVKADSRDAG